MARLGAKVSRSDASSILKNTFSVGIFLMKPAPYLFSGPNWLYGAFGGKIVLDENFAQFCVWKNEFERAFEAKLSEVFVRNNFPPNAPYSQLSPERGMGPV